jgi:hypothetical protein
MLLYIVRKIISTFVEQMICQAEKPLKMRYYRYFNSIEVSEIVHLSCPKAYVDPWIFRYIEDI